MDDFRERLVRIIAEETISEAVDEHKARLLRVPPEAFLEEKRQYMAAGLRPAIQQMDDATIEVLSSLSETDLRKYYRNNCASLPAFFFTGHSQ